MRVFLTGASGYIGSAVAEALRSAGHEITGLARTGAAAERLRAAGVSVQRGDLHDPATFTDACSKADGVIHAAMANDPNAGLFDAAAVDAMLGVLRGTGKPFVYTSGVWVLGSTGGKEANEDTPVNPIAAVQWRPAVERTVLDAAAQNIRTVVIRPGMVYGRGGGAIAGFVKSARETGTALHVGNGENHWVFVHVDDLAQLYVLALEKAPAGTLLLATSGPALKVKEVAAAASKAAGAEGRTQEWDPEEAFNEMGPVVEGLLLDQKVSSRRAADLLGWKPHAPGVLDEIQSGSYAA